jgi:hypothetical protein
MRDRAMVGVIGALMVWLESGRVGIKRGHKKRGALCAPLIVLH